MSDSGLRFWLTATFFKDFAASFTRGMRVNHSAENDISMGDSYRRTMKENLLEDALDFAERGPLTSTHSRNRKGIKKEGRIRYKVSS